MERTNRSPVFLLVAGDIGFFNNMFPSFPAIQPERVTKAFARENYLGQRHGKLFHRLCFGFLERITSGMRPRYWFMSLSK